MISALNVANTILSKGFDENIDISPMKLQKLIYFVYKKYYQDTKTPLFGECFETWRYGPVIDSVYHNFKQYGSNHIRDYYKDGNGEAWSVNVKSSRVFASALDYVWGNYKQYNGIYLSSLTHKIGSAWYKAASNNLSILSNEDIYKEEWYQ